MSKKIIALSLALLIFVMCFAGCTKGNLTIIINGEEYVAATDKDGNTIVNDENKIAIHPTDEKSGEVITDSNGDPVINYVGIGNVAVFEDKIMTDFYQLGIPDGWEGQGQNLVKKGSDNKVFIKIMDLGKVKTNNTALSNAQNALEGNKELIKALEMNGYKIESFTGEATITAGGQKAQRVGVLVKDPSGAVVQWADGYYFEYNKRVYKAEFGCTDPAHYDASFDFATYLRANFTLV